MTSDTKQSLLACAQDLIQERGVNGMSYNDLSQLIGIRKASIHYHFPKKDDLVKAIVCDCQKKVSAQLSDIRKSGSSTVDKLNHIADIYAEGIDKNKLCPIVMLSTEFSSLTEEVKQAIVETNTSNSAAVEEIVQDGLDNGSIKSDLNASEIAYAFMSFLLGSQVISRCMTNTETFRKQAQTYIKSLCKA